MELSHIDKKGNAVMVDISAKPDQLRTATATGEILLQAATIELIRQSNIKKGDVLATARIAGISAAKKTSDLIPLCHNLPLNKVAVDFTIKQDRIIIEATAVCTGKTGVEMEALTAVSTAALTIYDMCKAVDKQMVVSSITLSGKKKENIS